MESGEGYEEELDDEKMEGRNRKVKHVNMRAREDGHGNTYAIRGHITKLLRHITLLRDEHAQDEARHCYGKIGHVHGLLWGPVLVHVKLELQQPRYPPAPL